MWRSCSIEVKNSLDLRVQPSEGMHRRLSPELVELVMQLPRNCRWFPGFSIVFHDFPQFSTIFDDVPRVLISEPRCSASWMTVQRLLVPQSGSASNCASNCASAEDYRDTTRLRTPLMWATDLVGLDSDPEQWTIAEHGFGRKRRERVLFLFRHPVREKEVLATILKSSRRYNIVYYHHIW